jgi:hypothetical protein
MQPIYSQTLARSSLLFLRLSLAGRYSFVALHIAQNDLLASPANSPLELATHSPSTRRHTSDMPLVNDPIRHFHLDNHLAPTDWIESP